VAGLIPNKSKVKTEAMGETGGKKTGFHRPEEVGGSGEKGLIFIIFNRKEKEKEKKATALRAQKNR